MATRITIAVDDFKVLGGRPPDEAIPVEPIAIEVDGVEKAVRAMKMGKQGTRLVAIFWAKSEDDDWADFLAEIGLTPTN